MSNILRQLQTGLIIGECDGKATLARAGDVFTGYVNSDLRRGDWTKRAVQHAPLRSRSTR